MHVGGVPIAYNAVDAMAEAYAMVHLVVQESEYLACTIPRHRPAPIVMAAIAAPAAGELHDSAGSPGTDL